MLYNPKWNETKPANDIHSLESLVQWLETKNPDETYKYFSNSKCLCAQYYRAKGYWLVHMTATRFYHGLKGMTYLPPHFNDIASYYTEAQRLGYPQTFGGALKAARAINS